MVYSQISMGNTLLAKLGEKRKKIVMKFFIAKNIFANSSLAK